MSVTNQIPRKVSIAAPGATLFPYDFKVLSKFDLLVEVDGVAKTVDADYTVSGVGLDAGGDITFIVPLAGGETVMRKRNMSFERANDFQQLGDLRSPTLNNDQDAPVMMLQQVADDVSRAIKLPKSTTGDGDISGLTPLAPLVISADGNGVEAGSTTLTGDMLLRPNLAAPGGSGLVNPNPVNVKADGTTNDTAALTAALAVGQTVQVLGDIRVTAVTNPLGAEIVGDGRLLKAITGGDQQINSRCDLNQHVFGQEYLSAFHSIILNKSDPATIRMSGDSTTNGDAATSPFRPWEILQILGTQRGHSITTTNAGHSGEHTGQWVSDHVAGDIAANPTLYVVRWGINDPFAGRSIEDFATSLRAGLAQCRASKTLAQMSILLMSPSSTSDTPNDRDERWYEQARLVCRQAARDYQCCFIDTYAIWRDSRPAAGVYMDNPFGDGRAIHPLNVMNAWIYSKVAEVVFPEGLRPYMFASTYGTLTASSLPNRYRFGYSMFSGGVGASDFGVTNATVTSFRSADGAVMQRAHSNFNAGANNGNYPMPQIMERMGLDGTWYVPHTEPSLLLTSLLQNSWVDFAANNVPRAKKTNNTVTLSGLIKNGTTTNGTILFTLPAGYRPWQSVEAFLCATGPTGTTTPCVLHITSAGVCTIQGGANNAFIALSGISFEVGG